MSDTYNAVTFAAIPTLTYLLIRMSLLVRRKRIEEKNKSISISKLDADLWKLLSKYIRSKDADWKNEVACFTCGKRDDWRAMDAGHYIPKATSGSVLKFYSKNLAPQCITCNRLKGGNYEEYKKRLILTYGEGIIEELNALRQSQPMTITDYQTKINYYKQWLKSH